jgi:phosphopantetheine adenylyltransferase
MSRSFDYRKATLEEAAHHLNTVQLQAYSKLVSYYQKKEDTAMLAKLEQAKRLSKILKLTQEYDAQYGKALEGGV